MVARLSFAPPPTHNAFFFQGLRFGSSLPLFWSCPFLELIALWDLRLASQWLLLAPREYSGCSWLKLVIFVLFSIIMHRLCAPRSMRKLCEAMLGLVVWYLLYYSFHILVILYDYILFPLKWHDLIFVNCHATEMRNLFNVTYWPFSLWPHNASVRWHPIDLVIAVYLMQLRRGSSPLCCLVSCLACSSSSSDI